MCVKQSNARRDRNKFPGVGREVTNLHVVKTERDKALNGKLIFTFFIVIIA